MKNNQELLFENISDEFRFLKKIEIDEDMHIGHGRIETRKCSVIKNFQHVEKGHKCLVLKTVIKIESTGEFKIVLNSKSRPFGIIFSSFDVSAKDFQHIIRSHRA